MIVHHVINSLPDSDNKAEIPYHIPIHVLTAKYEHMAEVWKTTRDNDDISGCLDFGS